MKKIIEWWNWLVCGKYFESVKVKKQFKPDRSLSEQPYDEIDEDRVAHDKVEEIFWYCRDKYDGTPCDNGLIYHKTTLEILESEGGRELLFRHNRYRRHLFKGTMLFARPFFWHQTAEQMNEYLNALEKEKSTDIKPALELGKRSFVKGQKIIATYHAYCTGVIVKRTTRKTHLFSRESDGKCWWWNIKVHEPLGDRWHWGIIEVPETCIEDLKEYIENEKARMKEPFYKQQLRDPNQRPYVLQNIIKNKKAESFLTA